MADPISLGSVAGVMAIREIVSWLAPTEWNPQYRIQNARDNRLEAFQRRQQLENLEFQKSLQLENQGFQERLRAGDQVFQEQQQQRTMDFQRERDVVQQHFQLEVEAQRLAVQEKMEMRRLQFQQQMERQRSDMQRALAEMNIRNSQETAKFQAIAMRETQILVARENAQNMLQDRMVQMALKDFPLNISPLVLLKNRPHSLASLLRFTIGEDCDVEDVCRDVKAYSENPEALNIFVAPVYVDSKIKNRQILSDQIWDTTYQKLESFFTKHYNRRSQRPVIFYPTAWNDKFNPGMHASETLHFFLKDMPCIVIEPRFDGLNFRLMISAWGLGYASTEHIRTELNFSINIDEILAQSVYERSKKALAVLSELCQVDIPDREKAAFYMQESVLKKNIKCFEALRLNERKETGRMDEIEALSIYNIFKVEPIQDLADLSKLLSSQIGMVLACLSDIHHLKSTDVVPLLPSLMQENFPELYSVKQIREELFLNYRNVLIGLQKEACYLGNRETVKLLEDFRESQITRIQQEFALETFRPKESAEELIIQYANDHFDISTTDYEMAWEACMDEMGKEDVPYFLNVLGLIEDPRKQKQLRKKIEKLSK